MAASRKSPSSDRVPAAIAGCLNRHVQADDRLVVGFSGGIDSVVLLHALRAFHPSVAALHVHHGLSVNADRWSDFCESLCASWGVRLGVARVDVERGSRDGLEAAARRARHAVFGASDTEWIALAHHQGDRAETLLFNLLRGAGVRGAGAMRERNGRLLRPLLDVDRTEILAYAEAHGLVWVEDDSNADVRFARNYLRHRVLPVMRQRFAAADSRLASAAGHFAEAADLLDELAVLDLGGAAPEFPLAVEVLARLPESRARNVLSYVLRRSCIAIPGEARLDEALRQFLTADADRHPAVNFGGTKLCRRRGRIVLQNVTTDV